MRNKKNYFTLSLPWTWTVDLWETEGTTATGLLGKRTRGPALLSKTKRPASVMSLGLVASNSVVMPLISFASEDQLTARDYEAKLYGKLVPWTNNTCDIICTVVLQQDDAQHRHPIECNVSCKSKISPSGRKTRGRYSLQKPTHWTTL